LFNVMGLSIDERTDKWQKYLEADEMPWNRYLIGKGWDNALIKELGINNVPRNLLLDANGVIVYEHVDIRQILLKIPGLAVKE
ncbi:MAG TPA: thioredoxin-like domain-containing protein, partial [Chitinophagaceae bacterium]|nr:thioredoxin-like domain-containing protein [Chitinophagaceae bacterium]